MALSKVTYTDGTTVIGATNLNAIQDEIIANASAISGKQATLTAGTGISITDNVISVSLSNANTESF